MAAAMAEVTATRQQAEETITSLNAALESARSRQAVSAEEAAMLRATLDKVQSQVSGPIATYVSKVTIAQLLVTALTARNGSATKTQTLEQLADLLCLSSEDRVKLGLAAAAGAAVTATAAEAAPQGLAHISAREDGGSTLSGAADGGLDAAAAALGSPTSAGMGPDGSRSAGRRSVLGRVVRAPFALARTLFGGTRGSATPADAAGDSSLADAWAGFLLETADKKQQLLQQSRSAPPTPLPPDGMPLSSTSEYYTGAKGVYGSTAAATPRSDGAAGQYRRQLYYGAGGGMDGHSRGDAAAVRDAATVSATAPGSPLPSRVLLYGNAHSSNTDTGQLAATGASVMQQQPPQPASSLTGTSNYGGLGGSSSAYDSTYSSGMYAASGYGTSGYSSLADADSNFASSNAAGGAASYVLAGTGARTNSNYPQRTSKPVNGSNALGRFAAGDAYSNVVNQSSLLGATGSGSTAGDYRATSSVTSAGTARGYGGTTGGLDYTFQGVSSPAGLGNAPPSVGGTEGNSTSTAGQSYIGYSALADGYLAANAASSRLGGSTYTTGLAGAESAAGTLGRSPLGYGNSALTGVSLPATSGYAALLGGSSTGKYSS
eukprot:GHRR01004113.1.p1 GENE.GHRR01004113.1~~GHRR01004113.1.p1  ORF type:complete len:623 (+),score=302.97 GHRR01004113.1:59-1870(+)